MLVLDPEFQRDVIADRRARGIDRFDEVWEGVYVMSPLADDQHQGIATRLGSILDMGADLPAGSLVRVGINISDRPKGWKKNFRCPDVAVFLPGTTAINQGAFWQGGPDFAVEVRSRGDRARKKLPFYASVGTRELLIVDRNPWALELYRLDDAALRLVGKLTPGDGAALRSAVVPLTFGLRAGAERPVIEVAHADGRRWDV
jgi:hypothetical protein